MIYNFASVGCDKNHFTAFIFGKILWPNRFLIVICLTFKLSDISIVDYTMNCHFIRKKKKQRICLVMPHIRN